MATWPAVPVADPPPLPPLPRPDAAAPEMSFRAGVACRGRADGGRPSRSRMVSSTSAAVALVNL